MISAVRRMMWTVLSCLAKAWERVGNYTERKLGVGATVGVQCFRDVDRVLGQCLEGILHLRVG